MFLKKAFVLPLVFAVASLSFAQTGDKGDPSGTVQEEVWKRMDVPPAPILSPTEALESIRVADGFRVELVASEPLVNDPVAVSWDEEGRIWAVEMWSYMPDPDGNGEDQPNGRVVVLEDLDSDGVMDKSTVFIDQLVMPRAITFVEGGVLIADPPSLWYCQDTDGDLKSDSKVAIMEYATTGNVEHTENALMHGIDNWIYNSKSSRRFKFENGAITAEKTHFRGQWGMTQDDYGRLFYTRNSVWLLADTIPWETSSRNVGHSPEAGIDIDLIPANRAYSDRINPGTNRSYREGALGEDNRLLKVTGVSGPVIYRGDNYPLEYRGNAFSPDPVINSIGRFTLQNSGLGILAEHQTEPHPKWGQVEFLGSTDERFRPVNLYNGPDGNLYVVDMYRGIAQHKEYLTTFLRKQILERGLDKPVGLGRIYRVVHDSAKQDYSSPALSKKSSQELVALLEHANGWWRDTAQRLLVQRGSQDNATTQALRNLLHNGNETSRIHAIWTLHGTGNWTEADFLHTQTYPSAWVQSHALRASRDWVANGEVTDAVMDGFKNALYSQYPRVRLQAFSTFGLSADVEQITDTWTRLSEADKMDPYFIDCFVSNASGHEIKVLEALTRINPSSKSNGTRRAIQFIAKALVKSKNAPVVLNLLDSIALDQEPNAISSAIIEGLGQAVSKKSKPLLIDGPPAVLEHLAASEIPALKFAASQIDPVFVWEGKPGANVRPLTKKEEALFAKGADLYVQICAACHGPEGQGVVGLAPELEQSSWVLKSKEVATLIVAQGLMGPISVNGKDWNSAMPPHGNHPLVAGDGLSAVLTFIRNAWSNQADPISPKEVSSILEKYASHTLPWSSEELLNLK